MSPVSTGRLLLAAEFTILFVFVPLALSLLHPGRGMVFGVLTALSVAGIHHAHTKSRGGIAALWEGRDWPERDKRRTLALFCACAAAMAAGTVAFMPDRFLDLPIEDPTAWALVLILYPILSVVPQEALFRVFLMSRYKRLFPGRLALVAASALSFGFAHVVMGNWVAPVLSAVGGVFFAYSWTIHRSLKWVVVEHALYGCFVFTIGLGRFFVSGASQ